MSKLNLIEELRYRNFIKNCTDIEKLSQLSQKEQITVYCGFDLTAKSLHIGNLVSLMMMKVFLKHNHKVIALLGGGTTKIGDPSGKDKTRQMLEENEIQENTKNICKNIAKILSGQEKLSFDFNNEVVCKVNNNLTIVNNDFWLKDIKYIDFLRDIGRHFSINKMISMDSVKLRLEREQHLSFIEFNYLLLQSYDFLYLCQNYNCNLQIGGSDQWGNIINGVDLISKVEPEKKVFGLTVDLITRSDGKKMGKSENGAVWLSKDLFDPFDYYQYFRNVDDLDVEKFLKLFTNLDKDEIELIKKEDINKQKEILAYNCVLIAHSQEDALKTKEKAESLFIKKTFDYSNVFNVEASQTIVDLCANLTNLSRSEVKRLIQSNGIKINDICVKNDFILNDQNLIQYINSDYKNEKDDRTLYLISIGKKNKFTICIK